MASGRRDIAHTTSSALLVTAAGREGTPFLSSVTVKRRQQVEGASMELGRGLSYLGFAAFLLPLDFFLPWNHASQGPRDFSRSTRVSKFERLSFSHLHVVVTLGLCVLCIMVSRRGCSFLLEGVDLIWTD